MKIVADAHLPYLKEYFGQYGEIRSVLGREMGPDDVKDADILLVRAVTNVDEKLLGRSRIKFVGSMTAGLDHLDVKWLQKSGIAFSSAPGFNAPPVADYVVSMIAALMRKRLLPQTRIKAAVIGAGNVGSLVIKNLDLLGIDLVVCDPLRAETEPGFVSTPIDEIKDVDLITLHVPLTKDGAYPTHHFIDSDFILRQKPGTVMLNASRGGVVDSAALLQHGSHLVWCLDVFENEPEIDKQLLERAVIATPHIAGYSQQSKVRGMSMIYQAACQAGVVESQQKEPIAMPHQTLNYSGMQHHWQDIVLGIFNPVVMTAMMQTKIMPAEHHGVIFDELRNRFQFRHEFAFTSVPGLVVPDNEVRILAHLGIDLSSKS
ncbi:MAG TPA: 4-phosphoerythronate dehydrogenase [Gammaproteobacteria bacterium]|jgi:erythronate-4-phosphate dehydrogenase|nr:4-phosphoerythronate dehydrogenase [Gammaproteobacteria bacterium]